MIYSAEDLKTMLEEDNIVDGIVKVISTASSSLIEEKELSNTNEEYVYDISVKDNENFMTEHGMFVHNSRAANQCPFSSVNFGLDTSEAGRLVSRKLLECTIKGSGNGETFIYPISIMHIVTGINYLPGDPNYDIYKLAIKCSAKRLYPNFNFVDSPFQFKFLRDKKGRLLWKAREDYYVERGLVSREDLDNIPDQDPYLHSNLFDRIRVINKIDAELRKKHKECFDILAFFQGTEDEKKVQKAREIGVQFPALYDKLGVGYDERTTPARMGAVEKNETITIKIDGIIYNDIKIADAFELIKKKKEQV